MKKFCFLFLVSSFFCVNVSAQFTKYVVIFKDKAGTPFSIDNPSQFLSARSIARRAKQNIPIDSTDLPVVPRYIDSVRLSGNVTILDESKWLNQVCIATTDSVALAKINSFPFVVTVQPVKRLSHSQLISIGRNKSLQGVKSFQEVKNIETPLSPISPPNFYSYGYSYNQINIHDGEYLHNQGFHGEGMLIAFLDAGFYNYPALPAFDSVVINNQVIDTHDFVNNDSSISYDSVLPGDSHGMNCFSIIAGNIPGQFVGSCPKANFCLYRSEDIYSESPVEEQYWGAAAERADSCGVDIITTSLGYNLFDDSVFNYTYADMNGHTTIVAKAAMFAAKKGILVLAAAGNEGATAWHYIVTPADADSIITVGAVDTLGNVAHFSSYGPSSDGRIKPNVASVGVSAAVSSSSGDIAFGSGTSFATPNMAGLVTCLWQAFPEFNNMAIITAVEKSSSIYNTPNDRIGYGIPNFQLAFEDLTQQRILNNIPIILGNSRIKIYPNPFTNSFTLLINPENTGTGTFNLYDAAGKLYFSQQVSLQANQPQSIQFNNTQPLARGMYILRFNDGTSNHSLKLIMQ